MSRFLAHLALPVLLGLLVLAGVGLALRAQSEAVSGHVSASALQRSLDIQDLIEAQERAALLLRADLVAGNQAFVAYVSQALAPNLLPGMGADVASLTDILVERREQVGVDLLGLLGLDGRVIAATDAALLRQRELGSEASVRRALDSLGPATALWRGGDRLVLLAVKPLLRGATVEGFLVAGTRLEAGYARRLAQSAGVEAALLQVEGERVRLMASSLDPAGADALTRALGAAPMLRPGAEVRRIELSGAPHAARVSALFGAADQGLLLAMVAPAVLAPVRQALLLPQLLLAAGLLLLLGLAWWLLQLRLLSPLQALPDALDGAARGDLHRQLAPRGSALARETAAAFNRLMRALRVESAASARPASDVQSDKSGQLRGARE